MRTSVTIRGALAGAAASLAAPVLAAGNAHVIDDAAVETPGICHFENWASLGSDHAALVNVSPACTPLSLPNLEIGGFMAHARNGRLRESGAGLAPKLLLRGEDRGVGIALSAAIGYSIDRRRIETASLIVPFTLPVGDHVRVNINAGWQWFRLDNLHMAFGGAQLEYALRPGIGLMAEAFARDREKAGRQAGLRWTSRSGKGAVDIDLLAARYIDGITPTTLTIGVTIRR